MDVVERQALEELLRGEHPPGSWLRQDELAARFGTSKIPVREALRRAVEVELLRQAVPKLTVVDLAQAEYALDVPAATGSVTEANWQFHRALYHTAHWPRGLAITELLHAAMAPYVLLCLRSLGWSDPSDDGHRALLDACRRGDVDAAVGLLQTHLDHATHTVIDFLRPAGQRA